MSKTYRPLVIDILEAITDIEDFTRDCTFEQFSTDRKTQAAVLQKLTVVGEASSRINEYTRAQFPDVAWGKIIRSRNIIVHEYNAINLEIVWRIVEVHLPALKLTLRDILRTAEND